MRVDDGERIDGGTQMDPISPDLRTVANLEDGDWKALGPGESILHLDDSLRIGTGFHVYRLEPGASSTPHEHICDEHFLVLTATWWTMTVSGTAPATWSCFAEAHATTPGPRPAHDRRLHRHKGEPLGAYP